MAKTNIEWADAVWNPVTGCTKVSEGCQNCYAETYAKRFWGERKFTDVQCHEDRLYQPLNWKKPRKIFVNSMSDLFHEKVGNFAVSVFLKMEKANQHIFIILTKRPKRLYEFITKTSWGKMPLPNVWLGVSIESQETADERIPLLLQTPAAVRFVSCEPLLSEVNLVDVKLNDSTYVNSLTGRERYAKAIRGFSTSTGRHLNWVIVGGESGRNARPMHPDWVRLIRDQCKFAGIPFFFKQWGDYITLPVAKELGIKVSIVDAMNANSLGRGYIKVGKKVAGRLLDGREWNEYPGSVECG